MNAPERAPANIPPITFEKTAVFGYLIANGIAPSEIPTKAINRAGTNDSFSISSVLNFSILNTFPPINQPIAIPIGATEPAAAIEPIISGCHVAVPGSAKNAVPVPKAILLIGPPISKQSIPPPIIPTSQNILFLPSHVIPSPIPYDVQYRGTYRKNENKNYPTNTNRTGTKIIGSIVLIHFGSFGDTNIDQYLAA